MTRSMREQDKSDLDDVSRATSHSSQFWNKKIVVSRQNYDFQE